MASQDVKTQYEIVPMVPAHYHFVHDLAMAEGWNLTLASLALYHSFNPEGFFVGQLREEGTTTLVGCIATVSYAGVGGHVGIYIVHPSYRGNGYGLKLFQHAVQHLKALQSPPPASPLALPHTPYIGLDAVPEQTENYKKFGFQTAYVVTRYSFPVPREMMVQDPFHGPNLYSFLPPFYKKFWPHVQAYDEKCFPAPRRPLLEKLVKSPESFVAIYQNSETPDRIQGFGVLRPGNKGYLVGPLFADSLEIAIAIINHLLASVPPLGEPTSASISLPEIQEQETFIYVTLPETNPHGQTLVQSFGMEPLCVTIRMYLDGARPEEKNENIFSLTALEVG